MVRYDYYLTRNLALVRTRRGGQPQPPPALSRVGVGTAQQLDELDHLIAAGNVIDAQQLLLTMLSEWEKLYEIVHGPFPTHKAAQVNRELLKSQLHNGLED